MTIQELQAEADALQAQIEADLRSQGLDPAMGDHSHHLNEAWKCIQADIQDATRLALRPGSQSRAPLTPRSDPGDTLMASEIRTEYAVLSTQTRHGTRKVVVETIPGHETDRVVNEQLVEDEREWQASVGLTPDAVLVSRTVTVSDWSA